MTSCDGDYQRRNYCIPASHARKTFSVKTGGNEERESEKFKTKWIERERRDRR